MGTPDKPEYPFLCLGILRHLDGDLQDQNPDTQPRRRFEIDGHGLPPFLKRVC